MKSFEEWIRDSHPEFVLDEGWRDVAKGLAVAGGLAGSMVSGYGAERPEVRRDEYARTSYRKDVLSRMMMQFGHPGPHVASDEGAWSSLSDAEKKDIEKEVYKSLMSQFGGHEGLSSAMSSVADHDAAKKAYRQNVVHRMMMQFGHLDSIPRQYANDKEWAMLSGAERKEIEGEVYKSLKSQLGGVGGLLSSMGGDRDR